METSRPVIVKRVPQRLNSRQAKAFLREVEPILRIDRPQIVFDFSQVIQIDSAGVEVLLRCLAEVMKRDGDLKLAAVSPQAAVVLELTRTDRLFEIYNNSAEAARSFKGFLPNALRLNAQEVAAATASQAASVAAVGRESPAVAA